jgi:hypothetical protein
MLALLFMVVLPENNGALMGTISCLNCAQVLAEIEPLRNDSGKVSLSPPGRCEIEEEDDEAFYRCPRCRAKNIVIEVRTASGYPQLAVVACRLK